LQSASGESIRGNRLTPVFHFPFDIYKFTCTYIYTVYAAVSKGKRKFVFLGRQTIKNNPRMLFQQICPSMVIAEVGTSDRSSDIPIVLN
jgi:hypothetical protein